MKNTKETAISKLLNKAWEEKRKVSPKFSIRAFAKTLGVSHTYAQRLMKGEGKLSPRRAADIAARLNLRGKATLELAEAMRLEQEQEWLPKEKQKRSPEKAKLQKVAIVDLDLFPEVPLFQLFAILGLFGSSFLKGPWYSVSEVVGITGFPVENVTLILDRLEKMGIFKDAGQRRFYLLERRWEITSVDRKRTDFFQAHCTGMDEIQKKILSVPKNQRFMSTTFLSIPKKDFPLLMQAATVFLDEIHAFSKDDPSEPIVLLSMNAFTWFVPEE